MLDSFLSLQLGIDFGGGSSYFSNQLRATIHFPKTKQAQNIPAAATGSALLLAPGLRGSRLSGLRVQWLPTVAKKGTESDGRTATGAEAPEWFGRNENV